MTSYMKIFGLFYFVIISLLYSENNIDFSANILENIVENDIEKRIFKDNVIIKKDNMTLFTAEAVYIPSEKKVILNDNVKMLDKQDSLKCHSLILYDSKNKQFNATGNVRFYKNKQIIKSEEMELFEDTITGLTEINLYRNAEIIDSNRLVLGDTLYIHYLDSLINDMKIISNAQVFNYRYGKYNKNKKIQRIEDNISSKKMFINFADGKVNEMILSGMAETDFNIIEDSLVTGLSSSSGDSIHININDNIIKRMQMFGGVEGTFIPEENNSRIDSTVVYSADYIDYQVSNERSYLYNNAVLFYDKNELNAGEIFIDWENDFLEARVKESILPSINGFGDSPIYGQKMTFDLITKKGKILKGQADINQSYYSGKTITKDNDELYYINNSLFTTCDLEDPHYYFHSDKMKMIPNDRIIAKPMILYIQQLPIFYMPFAVFPNKNGDRISGWIMPSFGHKSSTGTYLDNLGYYYVIDQYSDYTFLFDIRDKEGIILDHEYRYKRRSGKHWYNYYLDGSLDYENKYYLSEFDDDISNIFGSDSRKIKNINWSHQQSFDPTQHLMINYRYKSELDAQEIHLNNRLEQNQLTSLSYQKRWTRNSLSIGFEEYEDLFIPNPTDINQINVYKWFTGPKLTFSLPQRKILGNGDKWYNDIYLSYNLSYDHGKESFTKNSCIDNDNNTECDILDENHALQESDNILWSNDDFIDIKKGSANNNINLSMSTSLGWLTISPNLNIREDWAMQYRNYDQNLQEFVDISGFNRRLTYSSSLTLNTKIYGIIPFNFGNLLSVRHKVSPQISMSYTPDLKNNYKNQFQYYIDPNNLIQEYDILGSSYVSSISDERKKLTFSLDNTFQAKINNTEGINNKIDFLNVFLTFDYDANEISNNKFSLIDSKWSFKKYNGGELFFIHMQHNMYDKETNELLFKKGKLPDLESLSFQMSSNFRLNGYSINSLDGEDRQLDNSISDVDSTKYNSILFMDEYKPQISSNEIWRSDLNLSIQGDYSIEDKKWNFNYFNLDTYNTIHLTKNWLFTYATGINLMDMKINSQSLKFYRELHCWEFMFTWWPDGYSKGFQLSINVKHPDLQDIRVRSSSSNRKFISN